jgi:uncharacterized integral membrane protein
MRALYYFTWGIRILIFLFLLVFAFNNTSAVTLHFFFGQSWELPLILLLFVFFVAGVLLGILTMLGILFRERRVAAALRREIDALVKVAAQAEPSAPIAAAES